jgi:hypothetical protein
MMLEHVEGMEMGAHEVSFLVLQESRFTDSCQGNPLEGRHLFQLVLIMLLTLDKVWFT